MLSSGMFHRLDDDYFYITVFLYYYQNNFFVVVVLSRLSINLAHLFYVKYQILPAFLLGWSYECENIFYLPLNTEHNINHEGPPLL